MILNSYTTIFYSTRCFSSTLYQGKSRKTASRISEAHISFNESNKINMNVVFMKQDYFLIWSIKRKRSYFGLPQELSAKLKISEDINLEFYITGVSPYIKVVFEKDVVVLRDCKEKKGFQYSICSDHLGEIFNFYSDDIFVFAGNEFWKSLFGFGKLKLGEWKQEYTLVDKNYTLIVIIIIYAYLLLLSYLKEINPWWVES